MEKHIPNLISSLWVLGFFAVLLGFSALFRPSRQSKDESESNSSKSTKEKPWIRVSARYQAQIIVTAAFFAGSLFLLPVMVIFRQSLQDGHGFLALGAVGLFLIILSVALAYAWMKGDLSWIRDKENPSKRYGNS